MSRLTGALLLSGFFLLCIKYYFTENDVDKQSVLPADDRISTASKINSRALNPSLSSPFGSNAYVPPDQAELVKARKLRMLADGYNLPEKYITMNLEQLTELGKAGDAAAALQLGDRYWSEGNSLESEVGMDFSQSPHDVAIHYFMLATRGGAVFVPDIVATRLYEAGGDMVDAAAWDMISGKFNNAGDNRPKNPTRSFAAMNFEQMNKANNRAAEIARQIGISW